MRASHFSRNVNKLTIPSWLTTEVQVCRNVGLPNTRLPNLVCFLIGKFYCVLKCILYWIYLYCDVDIDKLYFFIAFIFSLRHQWTNLKKIFRYYCKFKNKTILFMVFQHSSKWKPSLLFGNNSYKQFRLHRQSYTYY